MINNLVQNQAQQEQVQSQLDQASLDHKLNSLKNLDLDDAVVNVYVTKISPSNKDKRFIKIRRLKVHTEALKTLKSYVTECINGNEHICEFKTINTNQDNRFFYVEKAATDFSMMEEYVTKGDMLYIQDQNELNEFNSYVIQLSFGIPERSIFAFRYISGSWSLKQTNKKFFSCQLIQNELIVNIDSEPRFHITPYIDFLQFKDDIFISDVRQFETSMNFHERLIEKKEEAIVALCSSPAVVVSAKDPIKKVIGNDKHLMRQLASVHEKGYYKNEIWLTKLRKVATEAGNWKIKFDDEGKIEIIENKEYVKELLTLLQNKRVRTVVDGVIFDVDGELIALDS